MLMAPMTTTSLPPSKKKTSIWFSFCAPFALFILASALLFVNKSKCFETRIIENGPKNQDASEHRKLRNENVKEGVKTARKKKFEPSLISFEDLMDKFDQNAPVTNVVSKCLTKPDTNTLPVIFMTLGRSGGTNTWLMLSDLTNSKDYGRTKEYAGANVEDNLYFFDTTISAKEKLKSKDINNVGDILRSAKAREKEVPGLNNSEHGEWMVNYLCRLQSKRPDGLNGFKWKPNFDQFVEREEARESLQLLAMLSSAAVAVGQQPPIRLIRSRRNALDVKLSSLKHNQNSNIPSHCDQGDKKCIKKEDLKLFIENVPTFLKGVLNLWKQENLLDDVLHALNFPFVSVTYDTLFWADQISDREDEWNKMIEWVKPSATRVSWTDIESSMSFAPTTTSRSHVDIIENWEDVYKVIQGTEIEHLFRLN